MPRRGRNHVHSGEAGEEHDGGSDLKKLAALLLLVGLCLPYGCGVRPITGVWHELPAIFLLGIPVVATVIYGFSALLSPLPAVLERHSAAVHGLARLVYFGLVGAYLAFAVTKREGWPDPIDTAVALVVTGILIVWQERRGTKAARLPLLLLSAVGVPEVAFLTAFLRTGGVQVGGWLLTAGWLLAVLSEVQTLAAAPIVAHGG